MVNLVDDVEEECRKLTVIPSVVIIVAAVVAGRVD